MKKCKKRVKEAMYDRAIEAYRHHVDRYQVWMNFYALITGAMFIAYYSMDRDTLPRILTLIVGYISSVCWLASFLGYYAWLKNWIQILMYYENRVSHNHKKNRVYSLVYKKVLEKHGFSTQKITRIFIITVCIAWLVLIAWEITTRYNYCWCCTLYVILLIFITSYFLMSRKILHSSIKEHYDLKKEENSSHSVHRP